MRFTIDSNILLYSIDANTPDKQEIARAVIVRAMEADTILTLQVLGEFLSVVQRKFASYAPTARTQAGRWATIFPIVESTWAHVDQAARFAERYRLQFWDSLIWQTARSADVAVFISEDLQDGLSVEGMTVIDPFNPANHPKLAELLADAAGRA